MAINAGPIPGENYTSDTKNYPWRQPPQFTDIDEAIDMLASKITQFKVANGILNMVEIGIPVYKIAGMILTMGVGEGKWTVDYSLLLAGPLTRMIELICIGFGVDYDLGIEDDEDDFETSTFFKDDQDLRTPSAPGQKFKLLDEELVDIKDAAEETADDGVSAETEADLPTEGFMQMSSAPVENKKGSK